MARTGLPIPRSLRAFLDGSSDMSDGHMALVSTDSVHNEYGAGLYISPDCVSTDMEKTHFRRYVLAAYVGAIGDRYEWNAAGIPDTDRSQFFHFPHPVLNYFKTDTNVAEGVTRRPGWFARLSQWVN